MNTNEIEKETFESGAVRDKVPYRYDLCSPEIVRIAIVSAANFGRDIKHYASKLADCLLSKQEFDNDKIWGNLVFFVHGIKTEFRHVDIRYAIMQEYAKTLHEGAIKYGERNWEKGLPKENLINHALGHLIAFVCGDKTENHLGHLIWNVLTLIHFEELRKLEPETEQNEPTDNETSDEADNLQWSSRQWMQKKIKETIDKFFETKKCTNKEMAIELNDIKFHIEVLLDSLDCEEE